MDLSVVVCVLYVRGRKARVAWVPAKVVGRAGRPRNIACNNSRKCIARVRPRIRLATSGAIDLSADFDKVGLLFYEDQCHPLSSAARDLIKAFIAVETAQSSKHPLTGTKRARVAGSPLSLRSLSSQ